MPVFVSYDFDDRNEFDNLCNALRREGLDVRPRTVLAGVSLADQLREAINTCGACIFIATSRSLASAWCLGELGAFWGSGKRVILYRADRTVADSDLPPQLAGQVWTATLKEVCRASAAALAHVPESWASRVRIDGLRLFQHPGFYPIDLAHGSNYPSVNSTKFGRAIDFLLRDHDDRLAAMDLVYLREDNAGHVPDVVPDTHLARYKKLVDKYSLAAFIRDFAGEKERVFRNYKQLVYDIGATVDDVFLEILLHDVRNPIRSIVAARNSKRVSGRAEGEPSTRFVVQYVRDQGRHLISAMEGGSKVAYLKQFTNSKKVKATTTPVYDDRYGLVGILCVNIDVDAVESLDKKGRDEFFENYVRNSGRTPQFELNQWETSRS